MDEFRDKVAVITGGAGGCGKALARACLGEGMKVVVADVEEPVLKATVEELGSGETELRGIATDVSDQGAVEALADEVFERYGACHLLFNNAGVAAPSVNIWETTPNDWKWVYGVNVMGVIHGILAFVPRMIASGEEGHVINTSSGDGGVSPLPYQSVYASSKAAVSSLTECLEAQLQGAGTKLKASIFYPSGGLLRTGIWNPDRNRPSSLAREREIEGKSPTIEQFEAAAKAAGRELQFQDLDELAARVLDGIRTEEFIIMYGHNEARLTLVDRAERIGRGELPIDLDRVPDM